MQDQIIEEIKELVHTKTELALQLAVKEHDLWMYQNEKEEAKRLQGARKPRKDEEMAWPKLKRGKKDGRWRGEAGTRRVRWPEIITVSDALEGTLVEMAKAATSRWKQSSRKEEERCSTRARRSEVRTGKCFGWNPKKRKTL